MALIDDFKARYPEFDTAVVDQYLPVLEDVWPCYYGQAYAACNKEIVLNLVAHLLVIQSAPSTAPIKEESSRSVGSVSVSFESRAAGSNLSDFFGSTKYGQMYLMLTSTRRRAFFV
jgi:hypothetical protein